MKYLTIVLSLVLLVPAVSVYGDYSNGGDYANHPNSVTVLMLSAKNIPNNTKA